MKTLPVICAKPNIAKDIMLREYIRQDAQKVRTHLFITPPEQKHEPIELISEEENEKIIKKLKQINKEIFGI